MEDEIVYGGPANYFRGWESVGGKLTLYMIVYILNPHGFCNSSKYSYYFFKRY